MGFQAWVDEILDSMSSKSTPLPEIKILADSIKTLTGDIKALITTTNALLSAQAEDRTLLGKAFAVSTNDLTSGTTGGAETPQLLIINPTLSAKKMRIRLITFGTNVSTNNNIFRVYANPTVTSNGTPLTPVNLYLKNPATASVMQFFKLPTVSNSGTLFGNVISGATTMNPLRLNDEIVLDPGQKILIGVRPNTTGVTYSINVFWDEE